MALKWTFFYNQGQSGWTETYWSLDTSPQAAVEGLTDATLSNFTAWRSPLTGLFGIRAADTVNPRNSFFRPLNNVNLPNALTAVNSGPDVVSTDAVVRITGPANQSKKVFLRGLLDDDIKRNNDGSRAASAHLTQGVRQWFRQCSNLGFQLRQLVQPPAGGINWVIVHSASQGLAGPAYTKLTLPILPGGFGVGGFIRFTGVPTNDLPAFPRFTQIVAVDPIEPSITVPVRWRSPVLVGTPKMKFTGIVYNFYSWTGFLITDFSEHKTGRPFGAHRGRSRVLTRSR